MIYLQLFLSYLKIGFFGFGGGYAMLSLIQNEIVEQRGWITATQFADIVAVSQITPGPIAINSATYIGYTVAGVGGSVVATFAVCLPSLTLMLFLTRFFLRHRENRYIQTVVKAVTPIVVGMIASAALLMMFPRTGANENFTDVWSWILFAACMYGSYRKVNPILMIILSAVAGVVIYALVPMMS
ncbi:MAG: chromate transporter [Alistipes sp.]|nr:chromate transporter [Alistipes sp.]MBQ3026435.1 chromate transporter [Alistipes sp.]